MPGSDITHSQSEWLPLTHSLSKLWEREDDVKGLSSRLLYITKVEKAGLGNCRPYTGLGGTRVERPATLRERVHFAAVFSLASRGIREPGYNEEF